MYIRVTFRTAGRIILGKFHGICLLIKQYVHTRNMGRETYETQVTIVTEFYYVTGAAPHEAILQ